MTGSEIIQTNLLVRDAKVVIRGDSHTGSIGQIMSIYMSGGLPRYTLLFQDQRLGDYTGGSLEIVVK